MSVSLPLYLFFGGSQCDRGRGTLFKMLNYNFFLVSSFGDTSHVFIDSVVIALAEAAAAASPNRGKTVCTNEDKKGEKCINDKLKMKRFYDQIT